MKHIEIRLTVCVDDEEDDDGAYRMLLDTLDYHDVVDKGRGVVRCSCDMEDELNCPACGEDGYDNVVLHQDRACCGSCLAVVETDAPDYGLRLGD